MIRIDTIRTVTLDDEDPDASYLQQDDFAERLAEYTSGAFDFVGIRAEADIIVGNTVQTITSGGLWGIESDSSPDYLKEVETEEVQQLADILIELGCAPSQIAEALA